MRNHIFIFSILFIITVLSSSALAQRKYEFIFKYGVGKKNILNTRENKFTKDRVIDSSFTVSLKFTLKEKRLVYKKLNEANFFKLPEIYKYNIETFEEVFQRNPCNEYEFILLQGPINKTVKWDDCIQSTTKDPQFEKLMELSNYINSILIKKNSYKKLPKPRSGYQ